MIAAAFLVLCSLLMGVIYDFIVDDSFISWRYAQNWALHGELTWNIGHDPVEGFTSFLWVVVIAAGYLLGLAPETTSRAISILMVLAFSLLILGTTRDLLTRYRVWLTAALCLSPIVALHATAGMETTLAAFLVGLIVLTADHIVRHGRFVWVLGFFTSSFLAALARPETVFLSALIFAFLIAKLMRTNQSGNVRQMLLLSLPFIAAGILYFLWRYQKFGFLLPNAFYIKQPDEIGIYSAQIVANYLLYMPGFYFILACVSGGRKMLQAIGSSLFLWLPLILLVGYYTTIEHIQGYAYRFPYITYFGLVLLIGINLNDANKTANEKSFLAKASMPNALTWVFLTLVPLLNMGLVNWEVAPRLQHDRVAAGLALKGLDGRMLVSEAGALPLYSEWIASDDPGLSDEYIAHNGMDEEYVTAFNPDLIMYWIRGYEGPRLPVPLINVIVDQGYWAFDVIVKSGFEEVQPTGNTMRSAHVYFVRKTSPICSEIVARIRGLSGVERESVDLLRKLWGPRPYSVAAGCT